MEKICQHCGKGLKTSKKFTYNNTHNISYYDDAAGLTIAQVDLCPDCWTHLFELRQKVDDKFYKECVYGKQPNQK